MVITSPGAAYFSTKLITSPGAAYFSTKLITSPGAAYFSTKLITSPGAAYFSTKKNWEAQERLWTVWNFFGRMSNAHEWC
jgi:hypothetical protein